MPTERTLVIEGSGAPAADYEFTVSGSVEGGEHANLDAFDEISGSTVSGAVGTGVDDYHFDGEIESFQLDGDATVRLDGDEVDPATLGSATEESSDDTESDGTDETTQDTESTDDTASDTGAEGTVADFSAEERERMAALLEDFAQYLREG